MTAFTDTAGNIFVHDVATTVTFSVDVDNLAAAGSGNDIVAVSGAGNANFAFQLQFSDVNMTTSTDTLNILPSTPAMTTDLQQGLAGGAQLTVAGSDSVTIPSVQCSAVKFLCVLMVPATGASYTDADPAAASNIFCIDISGRKACGPGK